jgi:hypothetical protein
VSKTSKAEWQRRWRRANRTRVSELNRRNRQSEKFRKRLAARQQIMRELKEGNPCMDCKHYFPHYVMHFDHARGVKRGKVAEFATRGWSSFNAELDKCDIVCANCHMVRTYNRAR